MAKKYLDLLSVFIAKATTDLATNCKLECKHFFSGAALYVDGKICLSLTPVGLACKVSTATRDRLLKNKKAVVLQYFPKAPIKKDYVLFTQGVENSEKNLYQYVKQSIEYVITLPAPIKKQK